MIKLAIEISYNKKYNGKDKFGARLFMQKQFEDNGIELTRVSLNKFNKKKQTFSEYIKLNNKGNPITVKGDFKPDIIRNRKSGDVFHKYETLKNYKIVPSQKIAVIGSNKYENYLFLKKYQPLSCILNSFFSNEKLQQKFAPKILIKPINSNGGKGIMLFNKQDLQKQRDKYIGLEELYIVQDFKDFSKGYTGITNGIHDIRLMFAGKEIIETTLRIPQKGDFRSNIGSGGSQIAINNKNIPKDLLTLAKKIYKNLNLLGDDILSMDFSYCKTEKKRYLLEINASPGTRYYQNDKKILKKICEGLIDFFKSLKNKQGNLFQQI